MKDHHRRSVALTSPKPIVRIVGILLAGLFFPSANHVHAQDTLRSVYFVDGSTGYAAGQANGGRVAMIQTTNRGQMWQTQTLPDLRGYAHISNDSALPVIPSVATIHTTSPSQLTSIDVTPASVSMEVGEQRIFTVMGRDQNGNPYTLSNPTWTTSGGGTLAPSGRTATYTATSTGDFIIRCREGGTTIQGTATIHTTSASPLTSIVLNPTSVNMQTGQQQSFTATGTDQNGNPYTLSNPTWTTSGGGTLTPSGTTATYTATSAGDFTVTCTEGGTSIQGTATIHTTTPSQLTSIVLNPTSVNMQTGQQQSFTATGNDQNGNPYPLSNPTWTTSGGGTLAPSGTTATYTATQPGDSTITCGEGGTTIQGTATIHTTSPQQFIYYLAEGATGSFFDLELALANPNAVAAPVAIQYLKEDGSTVNQSLTLGAQSRQTILVNSLTGLSNTAVSTVVTSSNAVPLAVERTMTWDTTGYGSHTEKATSGAALTWYFAEGSEQGFFDTYLLLANPQTTANRATVQFLIEGGSPVTKVYNLLPTSRTNVFAGDVEEAVGTKARLNKAFGMVVTFDQPGVAERAMYFGTTPFWDGGHESAGVNAPSTSWFHAEGATGAFFDTFILLSNPNSTPATVTLRFLLDSGATVTRTKTVAANARLTVGVEGEDPLLANAAMATQVTSDVPVVSERAMYWAGYPNWYEAHNAFGMTATGLKWALGEGRVGGPRGYETYILLANPGTTAATVTVTYLREGGLPTIVRTYPVPATSRYNVYANTVPGLGAGERFGALIESTVPIAVERAMYSNAASQPGVVWAAGTNATGTPIP